MRKINFLLCIALVFSVYSCGLLLPTSEESKKSEWVKVEIINQTSEDVKIYSYDDITWLIPVTVVIIKSNEESAISASTDTWYHAQGISSQKKYGEKKFPPFSVPSNWDIEPMHQWVIEAIEE